MRTDPLRMPTGHIDSVYCKTKNSIALMYRKTLKFYYYFLYLFIGLLGAVVSDRILIIFETIKYCLKY